MHIVRTNFHVSPSQKKSLEIWLIISVVIVCIAANIIGAPAWGQPQSAATDDPLGNIMSAYASIDRDEQRILEEFGRHNKEISDALSKNAQNMNDEARKYTKSFVEFALGTFGVIASRKIDLDKAFDLSTAAVEIVDAGAGFMLADANHAKLFGDYRENMRRISRSMDELRTRRSNLASAIDEARTAGVLPPSSYVPGRDSFNIASKLPAAANAALEARKKTFLDSCISNTSIMKGAAATEKTKVCQCIVDKAVHGKEKVLPEAVVNARNTCLASNNPLPDKIGYWEIRKASGATTPTASISFTYLPYERKNIRRLVAYCEGKRLAFRFDAEFDAVTMVDFEGSDDAPTRMPVFSVSKNGMIDAKGWASMALWLVKLSQTTGMTANEAQAAIQGFRTARGGSSLGSIRTWKSGDLVQTMRRQCANG